MAHYSTSSSSSESEEYSSADEIRQPATPATRRQSGRQWPPRVPSSPPTSGSSPRSPRHSRRGTLQFQNFFMPLSPGFVERTKEEVEAQEERMDESIKSASGSVHGFHYTPGPKGDGVGHETSSEEEEGSDANEDETPGPAQRPPVRYPPVSGSSPRGRYQPPVAARTDSEEESGSEEEEEDTEDETSDIMQRAYPPRLSHPPRARSEAYPPHLYNQNTSESESGSEEEEDSDDESTEEEGSDDEVPHRPIIHEPPTPVRSRSKIDARLTPERHNFTLSELKTRSNYDSDACSDDEDGLSIVHPTKYSEAGSSPPRESILTQCQGPSRHYPSPPPTEAVSGDDLVDEFGNLACDPDLTERERFLRKQKADKWWKRRRAGSYGKRSIAISMGSDTDDEDVRTELGYEEQHYLDSASGLRRLRRKTLEGNNRTSLLFEDPPQRIPEMDEPETDAERHDTWSPPRRVPDMNTQGMGWGNELPYWREEVDMEL